MTAVGPSRALGIAISILALADGVLHLLLNQVLFRGNFFGPINLPPGVTQPFPLPLNQLFTLNGIGYVVLVVIFWITRTRFADTRWLIDAIMIVYAIASVVGWLQVGGPNPMGLGYLSKGIELLLIVVLLVDIWASQQGATATA